MGTQDSWGVKMSSCVCERNKTGILWAYIEKERGLPGEGINTRYNPRLPYSRKIQDYMDRQHKIVDWVVTDRTNREGGRQTSMEKDCSWCGQSS